MGRRGLGSIVLFATLSVIGVVLTQILWLDSAFRMQREQVELQKQQQAQLEKQFNDRVIIALTRVTERILSINKDPSDLFDAVKQERPNYFAVTINDTLHPYLLEALLTKEFQRRNIKDDFEYGIYDCFTDSIVYGNYVDMDSSSVDSVPHTELLKLDKDGHYFGVYFPQRSSSIWDPVPASRGTWIFPALVTLIVFSFFAYSVWVILRQKRLGEMKNDFIGNMTHELKTPISTIALSSEVISDPSIVQEPERLKEYARIIRSENERLRTQVERVLQLATLDRGDLQLENAVVDIREIIRAVLTSFKLPFAERSAEVHVDLGGEPLSVLGDGVHLSNVFFNLFDNAMKYSTGAPDIRITANRGPRWVEVKVKDRGLGIHPKDIGHIFERFFRVSTGNVHNVKGFGLGLHYVQQIVHAHGGTVEVRSEPGEGSEFTVRLPLSNKERR
ncbi:MAG: HAMP domain-containing histidine kinase [Flavobacteriales bacterium]|nr:HAMP domain-containing histidine kinase [Flavobacteriales bacterium]